MRQSSADLSDEIVQKEEIIRAFKAGELTEDDALALYLKTC